MAMVREGYIHHPTHLTFSPPSPTPNPNRMDIFRTHLHLTYNDQLYTIGVVKACGWGKDHQSPPVSKAGCEFCMIKKG